MKRTIVISLFFLFVYSYSIASDNDSLYFLNDVKEFAANILKINGEDFYNFWNQSDNAKLYLYVSQPDKVEWPNHLPRKYISFGINYEKLSLKRMNLRQKAIMFFATKLMLMRPQG